MTVKNHIMIWVVIMHGVWALTIGPFWVELSTYDSLLRFGNCTSIITNTHSILVAKNQTNPTLAVYSKTVKRVFPLSTSISDRLLVREWRNVLPALSSTKWSAAAMMRQAALVIITMMLALWFSAAPATCADSSGHFVSWLQAADTAWLILQQAPAIGSPTRPPPARGTYKRHQYSSSGLLLRSTAPRQELVLTRNIGQLSAIRGIAIS